MDSVLVQILLVAILGAIPITECLSLVQNYVNMIRTKMVVNPSPIRYSKRLLFKLTNVSLEVGKGYGLIALIDYFTDIVSQTSIEGLCLFTVGCLCHSWSPFKLFKESTAIIPFILGVLAMVTPWLTVMFLGGLVVSIILLNSITIGRMLNGLGLFIWAYILDLETLVPMIVIIIGIEATRNIRQILDAIEKKPTSLVQLIHERLENVK